MFNLHTVEAAAEHELRWIRKIVSAYEFHKETAERQSEAVKMQYSNMTERDLLVWIDWKANFTLPQGSVQTNDQYWAQSRMEVSCLGMVVYKGQHEGPPQKTGVVYISDIIDHTCLACCLQMEELKKTLWRLVASIAG